MKGKKRKNKKGNKVKSYNVKNINEISDRNKDIGEDTHADELKADQILIKVDIKTGKVIVDNLEKFWHNFGVISIPNLSSKVIELSAYTIGNSKKAGGDE
ncbi:hypothetical protein [Fervidicola ferrireducens]|nr:hypothetical protein [Fervidicola ferrireducens]